MTIIILETYGSIKALDCGACTGFQLQYVDARAIIQVLISFPVYYVLFRVCWNIFTLWLTTISISIFFASTKRFMAVKLAQRLFVLKILQWQCSTVTVCPPEYIFSWPTAHQASAHKFRLRFSKCGKRLAIENSELTWIYLENEILPRVLLALVQHQARSVFRRTGSARSLWRHPEFSRPLPLWIPS